MRLVGVVAGFMKEIVQLLPAQVELEYLRRQLSIDQDSKDEESRLMAAITAEVRKQTKDPFVAKLL